MLKGEIIAMQYRPLVRFFLLPAVYSQNWA